MVEDSSLEDNVATNRWPTGTFMHRLTDEVRSELLGLGTLRAFPPGQVLISQGDRGTSVWILLDALVKVTGGVENGVEATLAIRVSGDIVGDMSAMDGSPRSATVTTCGRAVCQQIKGPVFRAFLARRPAAALALAQVVADRLRWANQRRLDFAGYETKICLARVLLALISRHGRATERGVSIGVPLTRAELGMLVGAKEITAQKALRELAAEKLIQRGHRDVVVKDVAGLAELADLPFLTKPY
ncbi:Crp/Fnr family transcriptional regulator [Nonomuraea recticatena]|uniref:Crp/Fnr family transcriptional regulator n=1 Tax=Nonomuraea recticatena TaxID=46178 RepID=A0ABN3SBK1_9ACTN